MLKMFLSHFDFFASFSPRLHPLFSFLPAFSPTFFSSPPPPRKFLGALSFFSNFGGCKCCSDRFAGSFSIENGSVERCAKNKRHIVICFLWCCQKRWCHQNCKNGVISWGSLVRTYFVPVTLCSALLVAGWVGSPFTLMVQPWIIDTSRSSAHHYCTLT